METTVTLPKPGGTKALRAVGVAGLIAGTLDIGQALILFGLRVPFGIAAGILGRDAAGHGGPGTYVLGLFLHYFIATCFAAAYYLVSCKLIFLVEHPLVCGIVYGMIVELTMDLAVLPLSALHDAGPYELHDLLVGLGVHSVTVGLPIAYCVRRLGR